MHIMVTDYTDSKTTVRDGTPAVICKMTLRACDIIFSDTMEMLVMYAVMTQR